MANFMDIVKNAPQQNAFAEQAVWSFRSMLEALQYNVLQTSDYLEDEVVDALQAAFGDRLTVHTIFDILHDSDECCSAEVLCVDGTPTLLYKRIGDRSEYSEGLTVLDPNQARGLLAILVEYRTKAAFARMAGEEQPTPPEELLWEGTQYLVPLSTSAFYVGSPKWACGFAHAFSNHKAYLLDEQGKLVRVMDFVKWANNLPSWQSKSTTHLATFNTERGEVSCDARNIIFTLLEDEAELHKLAARLSRPSEWQVLKLEPIEHYAMGFVPITQHIQGQTYPRIVSLGFTDCLAAEAFSTKFKEPQPGHFNMELPELAEFVVHIDKVTSMPMGIE